MGYKPLYENAKLSGIIGDCGTFGLSADNSDYQAFLKWLASQNKTLEQWLAENPEPPKPEPTESELKAQQNSDLANHLVELTEMVMELRAKAEAKGETLTPVSAELSAKLATAGAVEEVKP